MDYHVILTARYRSGLSDREDTFEGIVSPNQGASEGTIFALARGDFRTEYKVPYANKLTVIFYRAVPNAHGPHCREEDL